MCITVFTRPFLGPFASHKKKSFSHDWPWTKYIKVCMYKDRYWRNMFALFQSPGAGSVRSSGGSSPPASTSATSLEHQNNLSLAFSASGSFVANSMRKWLFIFYSKKFSACLDIFFNIRTSLDSCLNENVSPVICMLNAILNFLHKWYQSWCT